MIYSKSKLLDSFVGNPVILIQSISDDAVNTGGFFKCHFPQSIRGLLGLFIRDSK